MDKDANVKAFPRRLRLDGERRDKEAASQAADERAAVH
jgi:hypothetical protein